MSNLIEATNLVFSSESKDIAIADTIINQIYNRDMIALGAIDCRVDKRYSLKNGVLFHRVIVKQGESRCTRGNIKITLNWKDLYDVVIYSTDRFGAPKKVLASYEDAFAEDLLDIIRKIYS